MLLKLFENLSQDESEKGTMNQMGVTLRRKKEGRVLKMKNNRFSFAQNSKTIASKLKKLSDLVDKGVAQSSAH